MNVERSTSNAQLRSVEPATASNPESALSLTARAGFAFFTGQPSQQHRRYEECTTGQRSANALVNESRPTP